MKVDGALGSYAVTPVSASWSQTRLPLPSVSRMHFLMATHLHADKTSGMQEEAAWAEGPRVFPSMRVGQGTGVEDTLFWVLATLSLLHPPLTPEPPPPCSLQEEPTVSTVITAPEEEREEPKRQEQDEEEEEEEERDSEKVRIPTWSFSLGWAMHLHSGLVERPGSGVEGGYLLPKSFQWGPLT